MALPFNVGTMAAGSAKRSAGWTAEAIDINIQMLFIYHLQNYGIEQNKVYLEIIINNIISTHQQK